MKKFLMLVFIAVLASLFPLLFALHVSAQVYEIANGLTFQPVVPLDMSEDLVIAAVRGPRVVKWRQPPDMEFGVNIPSIEREPLVADDWRCTDPRAVTDVHYWGSFVGWQADKEKPDPNVPLPKVDGFWIRIFEDIPAGVDPKLPFSHPGEVIFSYEAKIDEISQEYEASIKLPDGSFEHKYYYSLDLPEPFEQKPGNIYWIAVSAIMANPETRYPWGWETSTRHWNDNATRLAADEKLWQEITLDQLPPWYKEIYQTVDMAFELTVPYRPPPPPELVKWQQRPDMQRGTNVLSNPTIDPPEILTVADDWLCLGGSPVADLHFWGSYLKWGDDKPEPPGAPPGVKFFRIHIFSDQPVTPDGFSRPDLLLYEAWVDNFNEAYVASIPLVPGQLYEHKYRYDLDLPRIFWQQRDRIYWLNISAVPREPEFQWGWESSIDRWNDYAVEGFYLDPDDRNWRPIVSQLTKDFVDMSFELTTCRGPIKWLQFPDMASGFNVPALPPDRILADDWYCREGKPITEVHFWGSYLDPSGRTHWEQENPGPPESTLPPTPGVENFRLSFHADVPAGTDPDMPWSHPGELLQEALIEKDQVIERYWDSVPHTGVEGAIWWEHKFYYIVKLEKPFEQKADNVYWLDIAARPAPGSNFVWGWETSKDHWNDSAVRGDGSRWQSLGAWGSDFDDLVLGSTYNPGDSFVTSGIPVAVKPFAAASGFTKVVISGSAGGSGKELQVSNVLLDFAIADPLNGLSFLFGELGGQLRIEVNGVGRNINSFSEINGAVIGGSEVSVVFTSSTMGRVMLTGPVSQFALAGQELFIDDLTSKRMDMAFLLYTEDDTDVCEADFDRDGDVDQDDLEDFAEDYGRDDCYLTGDCEGDFKYDGDVDGMDVKTIMDDYGRDDCPCRLPLVDTP